MYHLTKNGLLTSNGESDILFDDLVNKYKENSSSNSIEYCETDRGKGIKVEISGYSYFILLTEEQLYKFKNGISDPYLDVLRELIKAKKEENDYKKALKEILKEVDSGNLPDKTESICIYQKYLDDKSKEAKAKLAKQGFSSIFPFLSSGLGLYLTISTSLSVLNTGGNPNAAEVISILLGIILLVLGGTAVLDEFIERNFLEMKH